MKSRMTDLEISIESGMTTPRRMKSANFKNTDIAQSSQKNPMGKLTNKT